MAGSGLLQPLPDRSSACGCGHAWDSADEAQTVAFRGDLLGGRARAAGIRLGGFDAAQPLRRAAAVAARPREGRGRRTLRGAARPLITYSPITRSARTLRSKDNARRCRN